ncbi:MAG: Do family serine endopeptidase [Alphaproteobacteria bacterium]|nr:Do family serine endopeptidase [Alphaproteobacteria bacterium]
MTSKPTWRAQAAAFALAVTAIFASPAPASAKPTPDGFAELSDRLMPAVVNIATTQRIGGVGDMPRFPRGSPQERYNDMLGEPTGEVSSLGSGFIISPDGVIVTNNHVIEEADEIRVIFQNGDQVKATLVGRDIATDIAVLRVKTGRPLPYVSWGDSAQARVGEWVIAIGNPFGLGGSVSAGIISARNRNIDAGRYDDFLQTDAAINRGNSGGPLFDMDGQVIGVNTAIVSPTGGSVGVGFATPSELARSVVDQILKFGETRRGWLGVRIAQVSPDVAARNGLPRPKGALVAGITDGSPAAKAGLRPGDVVVSFDGKDIVESRNLTRLVADAQIDRTVTIEFLRSGKKITAAVKIGRLDEGRMSLASSGAPGVPGMPDAPPLAGGGERGRILGMTLAELSPELRRAYAIGEDVSGLAVVSVDPQSDAASKVRVGDVIVEMTFEPVETIGQARALAARAERGGGKPMLLYISRAGEMTFRSVRARK